MSLYQNNGYVDIGWILDRGMPFNFVIGGRGTGKTYTSFDVLEKRGLDYLYLRRTQTQLDAISKPEYSPYNKINSDRGYNIGIVKTDKNSGCLYHMENVDGRNVPSGSPFGYTAALTTFSNIRGFSAENLELLLYDEFIPERHERPIRGEYDALMNIYESINRNRELEEPPKPPLRMLCLANSNRLDNAIFVGLGVVDRVNRMIERGQELYIDQTRGILIAVLQTSEISERKSKTALYKLNDGNDFSAMAVGNEFTQARDYESTKSRNLREYRPLATIGEICIYQHKSNGRYYVSTHISGNPRKYGLGDSDRRRFKRDFGYLYFAHLDRTIDFEKISGEILLTNYLS